MNGAVDNEEYVSDRGDEVHGLNPAHGPIHPGMTLDDDNESLLSQDSKFNQSNVSMFGKLRGGQELGAGNSTYRGNDVDSQLGMENDQMVSESDNGEYVNKHFGGKHKKDDSSSSDSGLSDISENSQDDYESSEGDGVSPKKSKLDKKEKRRRKKKKKAEQEAAAAAQAVKDKIDADKKGASMIETYKQLQAPTKEDKKQASAPVVTKKPK